MEKKNPSGYHFLYCFRKLTVKRCLLTDSCGNHSRREGSLFSSCRCVFVNVNARRYCHMQQYQRNLRGISCCASQILVKVSEQYPSSFWFLLPNKITRAVRRQDTLCCLTTTPVRKSGPVLDLEYSIRWKNSSNSSNKETTKTTTTISIRCIFPFLFIGREPTTSPANNCLQIMICSCVVPSECVLL